MGAWLRNWVGPAQDAQMGGRQHTHKVKVRETAGEKREKTHTHTLHVCVCVFYDDDHG